MIANALWTSYWKKRRDVIVPLLPIIVRTVDQKVLSEIEIAATLEDAGQRTTERKQAVSPQQAVEDLAVEVFTRCDTKDDLPPLPPNIKILGKRERQKPAIKAAIEKRRDAVVKSRINLASNLDDYAGQLAVFKAEQQKQKEAAEAPRKKQTNDGEKTNNNRAAAICRSGLFLTITL